MAKANPCKDAVLYDSKHEFYCTIALKCRHYALSKIELENLHLFLVIYTFIIIKNF